MIAGKLYFYGIYAKNAETSLECLDQNITLKFVSAVQLVASLFVISVLSYPHFCFNKYYAIK